jgi:hypothetical protein
MPLKRVRLALACALVGLASNAGSAIPFERLDGVWEGPLEYAMRSPPVEGTPATYMQVVIVGNRVRTLATRDSAADPWFRHAPLVRRLRFTKRPGTIAGTFVSNGRDEDGRWVEHQSLVLTMRDADRLLVYLLRVVNNVDLPRDDKNSNWSFLRVGTLERANAREPRPSS